MSLKSTKKHFPCREREWEQLEALFSEVDESLPESVFVFGQPAVGKTSIVSSYMNSVKGLQMAYVNCIECYTLRLLLDPIIRCFAPLETETEARCDNFTDLTHRLKVAHTQGFLKGRSQVLVLDGVEHLNDDGSLTFFSRLQELTSIRSLSVIFISRVIPEKFHVTPSVVLHFPQYSKDDLLKIFKLFQPEGISDELYSSYISSALAVFLRTTRDLVEMKTLILRNVLKYVEPLSRGEATEKDTMLLWRLVTPHLRATLNSAYQGITSDDPHSPSSHQVPELITHKRLKAFDLPYYAKYFLISAYLASYNSPKHDRRLFMKNHGKQKKRCKSVGKTQVSELLGPKVFSMDRLLAIFYAIMEEKASLTVNLISQISSLVELKLLAKMGDGNIDNPKFKCLASYDCVAAVADTLGFNVKKYLLD